MSSLVQCGKNFARDQLGAAAVEYAVLVALIAAAIVVTVGPVGKHVRCLFAELVTIQAREFPGNGNGPPDHANDPFGDDCP